MLYNKQWDVPPAKPALVSLAGLIAWLETQDPTTTYIYTDSRNCLIAQYLKAQGCKKVRTYATETTFQVPLFSGFWGRIFRSNTKHEYLESGMNEAAVGSRTFGEALRKARRYVKDDEKLRSWITAQQTGRPMQQRLWEEA